MLCSLNNSIEPLQRKVSWSQACLARWGCSEWQDCQSRNWPGKLSSSIRIYRYIILHDISIHHISHTPVSPYADSVCTPCFFPVRALQTLVAAPLSLLSVQRRRYHSASQSWKPKKASQPRHFSRLQQTQFSHLWSIVCYCLQQIPGIQALPGEIAQVATMFRKGRDKNQTAWPISNRTVLEHIRIYLNY